jgi:tetratricopeptide (TPR) repeat protein
MPYPALILGLLFTVAFTLSTLLQPWHNQWAGSLSRSGDFLTVLLGDGRRVFAGYFFRKADVYMHAGYYPSIFDQAAEEEMGHHLADSSGAATPGSENDHDHDHEHDHDHDDDHEHDDDHGWSIDPPRDWIDRFGRHFRPSQHVHLETSTDAREILPWLRISADLDPELVQTYTVGAYWLRSKLGKADEAEQFLREGLRANPGSHEILFELGRLYQEDRQDLSRARNVWELALKYWQEQAVLVEEPDLLAYRQITVHLAHLEDQAGNLDRSLTYWRAVHSKFPDSEAIQEHIDELTQRLSE